MKPTNIPIEMLSTLLFIKSEMSRRDKELNGDITKQIESVKKLCSSASKLPQGNDAFSPKIFCNIIQAIDKLDEAAFLKMIPNDDEGKLKRAVYNLIMDDLKKGIVVIDKCGLYPFNAASNKDMIQKAFEKPNIGELLKRQGINIPIPTSPDMAISMLFTYLKDVGEILCSYGIDFDLIIYNANKTGIETGIFLEFLLKRLGLDLDDFAATLGFDIETLTGFSPKDLINKIFDKLHKDGIYNCPLRRAKQENINLNGPPEDPNRKNQIREAIKSLMGSSEDMFGAITGNKIGNGPIGLETPGMNGLPNKAMNPMAMNLMTMKQMQNNPLAVLNMGLTQNTNPNETNFKDELPNQTIQMTANPIAQVPRTRGGTKRRRFSNNKTKKRYK
jgi:hypothetical protein